MQNEDVSPMKPPQSARHELLELNEGSALKSEIKLLKTKQTPSHSPSNNIETPRSDQEQGLQFGRTKFDQLYDDARYRNYRQLNLYKPVLDDECTFSPKVKSKRPAYQNPNQLPYKRLYEGAMQRVLKNEIKQINLLSPNSSHGKSLLHKRSLSNKRKSSQATMQGGFNAPSVAMRSQSPTEHYYSSQ